LIQPSTRSTVAWLRTVCLALLLSVLAGGACADDDEPAGGAHDIPYQAVSPTADSMGAFSGQPAAAPVYNDHVLIGYLFLTDQVLPIPGYSGKPITTLVGLDAHGVITGVKILRHQEPILAVGVRPEHLQRFIDQFIGISAAQRVQVGGKREGYVSIDAISGATITTMVLNAAITRSAHLVAESRGLLGADLRGTMGKSPQDKQPIWVAAWQERRVQIGVLVTALLLLSLILIFQDWLARHPSFLLYVRDGYLVFTLLFIGWYTLAQLSVVNVLTFVAAIMHDFQWGSFLIDPMMFILWAFVAMTLLLWGRGVYCGWLCPFGALQELVNQLGRRMKIKQLELPAVVHERLWALKYVILIALFGVSLQSIGQVLPYIEIEPFKTAITLRFQREWTYVLYAGVLVFISLFNRKFYCKYLCPLGAALAFPARLRLFDWLRRYKECGRPCQICATECEVQAIKSTGEINANECHYCLDCQVNYYNDSKCPPLADKRRRRERAGRAREVVKGLEDSFGFPIMGQVDVKFERRVVPERQSRDETP
jgi:NosR/NirI family nitrous oxide reductase transcriptional regulator